ncbi:MAG: DUF1559 domain-containing protein [Planctomycetota bacterium]
MVLACGGFALVGIRTAIPAAGRAATRTQCSNNLRQIGIAMLNYHDTYGSYPPAYIPDEKGQPKHSWRVLLLPFLEQQTLYDQYDFDRPWDSPENAALGNLMPEAYRCPSDTLSAFSETSFAMIVGPAKRSFAEVRSQAGAWDRGRSPQWRTQVRPTFPIFPSRRFPRFCFKWYARQRRYPCVRGSLRPLCA